MCCAERREPTTTTPVLRRENGVATGRPPHTPRHLASPGMFVLFGITSSPTTCGSGTAPGPELQVVGRGKTITIFEPSPRLRTRVQISNRSTELGFAERLQVAGVKLCLGSGSPELATVTDADQWRLRPTTMQSAVDRQSTEDGRASHARADASSVNRRLGC